MVGRLEQVQGPKAGWPPAAAQIGRSADAEEAGGTGASVMLTFEGLIEAGEVARIAGAP